MKLKTSLIILLFLCTLFSFSTINVYAADDITIWVPKLEADELGADVKDWPFYNNDTSTSISSVTVKNLGSKLSEYYLKWFRELGEGKWVNTELPTLDVEYTLKAKDSSTSPQDKTAKRTYTLLEVDVGTLFNSPESDYKITKMVITMDLAEETASKVYKIHVKPGNGKSTENGKKMIKQLAYHALEGVAAGSIEYGYNIGIPYSLTQRPLTDLMELEGNGYEFKSVSTIAYTFGYFYHPLLGNMYLNKEMYLPTKNLATQKSEGGETVTKEDLWMEALESKKSSIFSRGNIVIPDNFKNFENNLSDENVNEDGYKLTDIKIENGATRYSNVPGSKGPKNVLSYNVPMAVPYIFSVTNESSARLGTNSLRQIENYIYCLYNFHVIL